MKNKNCIYLWYITCYFYICTHCEIYSTINPPPYIVTIFFFFICVIRTPKIYPIGKFQYSTELLTIVSFFYIGCTFLHDWNFVHLPSTFPFPPSPENHHCALCFSAFHYFNPPCESTQQLSFYVWLIALSIMSSRFSNFVANVYVCMCVWQCSNLSKDI